MVDLQVITLDQLRNEGVGVDVYEMFNIKSDAQTLFTHFSEQHRH